MNLLRSLRAIIAVLIGEVADISRRVALMPPPPYSPWFSQEENDFRMYRDALVRLFIYVAVPPVVVLLFGVIGGFSWVVASAALLWAVPTIALLAVATPLGILWNLFSKRKESDPEGPRYVRFALSVLYLELALALLLIVVPVKNNPIMIPTVLLGVTLIGLGRYLDGWFKKGLVYTLAGVVVTALVFSFYFPNTFGLLGRWMGTWDDRAVSQIGPHLGETTAVPTAGAVSEGEGMRSAPRFHVSQVAGVAEGNVPSPGYTPAPMYSEAGAETTFVGKTGDIFQSTFTISKSNRESFRFESDSAFITVLWDRGDGTVEALKCGAGIAIWDPDEFPSADPQPVRIEVWKGGGAVRVVKLKK